MQLKSETFDRVLNKSQSYDVANACKVIDAMFADGPELLKRHVLMAHLKNFGLALNRWAPLAAYQDWYNASDFGVLQNPTEYIDYLLYCARTKPASCAEIGVYTGGLAVFSCAFHDIHGKEYLSKGGGVYTFWRQLRASLAQKMTMIECAHAIPRSGKEQDSMWMGIGILDYTTAAPEG